MIRAAALFTLAPAVAGAFELSFPVGCDLGKTCYIQQFVDHDPGPAAKDYTCGPLSYNGHDGTDIALPTLSDMTAGVAVLAAAPGTVKGRRDGMPDISVSDPAAPDVANLECGNGVLIDHGGGWETQYCHLRQGSVTARVGDLVVPGTPLGMVGMSGMAEFPHLHLSVRYNGVELDPFAPQTTTCNADPNLVASGMWRTPIPYAAGGILKIGLSTEVPQYAAIKAGLPQPTIKPDAPALVIWAFLFGGRSGDVVQLAISGPGGAVISDQVTLKKTQAQLFQAIGKKRKFAVWPTGNYRATAELVRDGTMISAQTLDIQIEN